MSMADNIRKKVEKRKSPFAGESEVRDLINEAAAKSLQKYLQRLNTGEIPIDNIADLQRVFGIYKEINAINDVLEGQAGQSALPEINMKTDKAIEDHIREGKITANEEEGTLDVMDMSADDVAELIRKMDMAQNAQNEGGF